MSNICETEANLRKAINEASTIAIAGHTRPDGDAIGACLALAAALCRLGKDVKVLLEDYDRRYGIIPGRQFVYRGDYGLLAPDLFIALDCSTPDRLGKALEVMGRAKNTAMLDHHQGNTIRADYWIADPAAPATALMVYNFISTMVEVDAEMGAAIYAGLVYDTGGFRHSSTTPEVLDTAAALMRLGIDFSRIYRVLMVEKPREKTPLLARALSRITYAEPDIAHTYIDLADKAELGGDYPDSVADYLVNIRGVNTAVYAVQKEDATEFSLRSRCVNVGEIASSLGGGGHKAAAGFRTPDAPAEAIAKFVGIAQRSMADG
ncbi:MAG: DHH family phosphoesterase [Defluviitaleaceae bacterium]|nr:DHH family phosphoesterase [Defluviitaleaceae bacterium]